MLNEIAHQNAWYHVEHMVNDKDTLGVLLLLLRLLPLYKPILGVSTCSHLIATITHGVEVVILIYRLRTPSSGTKMLVVIIQLSRMKPQGFGLQIQCSLHGTTAASPVLGENLELMKANYRTPFPF